MVDGPKRPEAPATSTSTGYMKTFLILVLLFAGSAILEMSVTFALRRDFTLANLEVDELEYFDFSAQLLAGRYEVDPRRTLGFVLILGALRVLLGDHLLSLELGVAIIFSLIAPLTYLLARREMGNRHAALLAGLGVMFWPPFMWFGASLYSEAAALPVFAAFLLAIPGMRGARAVRGWRWLGAGALLGFCMHIRPMYLLFSPFAALIAWSRSPDRRRGLVNCSALASGCFLVVLPWSVVASLHEGHFVLLSTIGGEVFAGGMNPELLRADRDAGEFYTTPAMRSTWVGPGKWLPMHLTGLLSPEERVLPYFERTKALSRHSLEWARENPAGAFYITVRKLAYMWGVYPFWNGTETFLGNIPALSLLLLGLAALRLYRRHLRQLLILWTPALFVTLLALVSWGSWRFRQPGDVGLIVLVASLPFAAQVNRFLACLRDANRNDHLIPSDSLRSKLPLARPVERPDQVGLAPGSA
jgi:hypothetical protein